jgi:hypothetical protein
LLCRAQKNTIRSHQILEIIAGNLKKRGWSLGWISAVDSNGRTIWIADAHRDNRKRFVAHADEKLTAFVELEAAIWLRKKFTVCSLSELSHTVTGQKTELYGAAVYPRRLHNS